MIILERETGFESIRSIFPFSSMDGIIEDTPIRQNVISNRYETLRINVSEPTTNSLTSFPAIVATPVTDSVFKNTRKPSRMSVEIIKKPRKIFFAMASLRTPDISVLKITVVFLILLTD